MTSLDHARHPFLGHSGLLAFAHRGGALGAPENTMAAFERAVALGYRYLETDARATADGALLAFHDARLERTTDGAGAVAELPWRTVRAARVAGREPIPLLEEVLDAFPEVRFNIDVKSAAAVRPLVAAVRRTGAWDRVCVGAFSDGRLAAVRAAAGPRLATSLGPRAVLGLRLRSLAGPVPADRLLGGRLLGAAVRRQAVCVQVPVRFPALEQPQDTGAVQDRAGGRGIRVVDRAFVRTAHRFGLQVHVWTVDDPRLMRELIALGVDGIMSDRIDVLRDVLVEHGSWSG
ncbi:glycerophosphodiester phosphodiesterase [Peterkaempfera bronchialis]|uniref:Glycerophosphodiester phosphodiesterase n=1 Tax=Peterkaempfera bronchialis TaxID=2126346 RepID=A0A345T6Y8_9ACTN|nr:glycerophosphodiester phosphodiesterase [Peterkaempfera bronchialis]AXI81743.1 glycerophosphodiester phosphodiesterase [Peterkaempfera bronchialis]